VHAGSDRPSAVTVCCSSHPLEIVAWGCTLSVLVTRAAACGRILPAGGDEVRGWPGGPSMGVLIGSILTIFPRTWSPQAEPSEGSSHGVLRPGLVSNVQSCRSMPSRRRTANLLQNVASQVQTANCASATIIPMMQLTAYNPQNAQPPAALRKPCYQKPSFGKCNSCRSDEKSLNSGLQGN
jgi:hypothetical protein